MEGADHLSLEAMLLSLAQLRWINFIGLLDQGFVGCEAVGLRFRLGDAPPHVDHEAILSHLHLGMSS